MMIQFSSLFIYLLTHQPKLIYKVSTSKRRKQTHVHRKTGKQCNLQKQQQNANLKNVNWPN
jgi:hypothetical protein